MDNIEKIFDRLSELRVAADRGELEQAAKGLGQEAIDALYRAQPGVISIRKMGATGERYKGYTYFFGAGVPTYICIPGPDRYYATTTIQSIDWEDHSFETLHNTYLFEFAPMASELVEAEIRRELPSSAVASAARWRELQQYLEDLEQQGFRFDGWV